MTIYRKQRSPWKLPKQNMVTAVYIYPAFAHLEVRTEIQLQPPVVRARSLALSKPGDYVRNRLRGACNHGGSSAAESRIALGVRRVGAITGSISGKSLTHLHTLVSRRLPYVYCKQFPRVVCIKLMPSFSSNHPGACPN